MCSSFVKFEMMTNTHQFLLRLLVLSLISVTQQSESLCSGECIRYACYSTNNMINLTCASSDAVLSVNNIGLALQHRSGRPCTEQCCSPVLHTEDCISVMRSGHAYFNDAKNTCNGKRQCMFANTQQQVLFLQYPCNKTQLPNHYVTVWYSCYSQLTSSTTSSTTISTTSSSESNLFISDTQRNNATIMNTPSSASAADVSRTAPLNGTAAGSSDRQWRLSQASLRDVITGAVGAVLILIIVILITVICSWKHKYKRTAEATSVETVQRGRAFSLSNFYDQPAALIPDPCSPLSPVSPVYSTISGIDLINPHSPSELKQNQFYHPMHGIKNRNHHAIDAYVSRDKTKTDNSLPTPPPVPYHAVQQPYDAADYLLPVRSNSPRALTLNPTKSSDRTRNNSIRSSGSHHVADTDCVDGPGQTNAKMTQFRDRQKSNDILTLNSRRRKQPSSRYRPASMQILSTDQEPISSDSTQYEEIPADFVTLPKRININGMRHRPPAPPPVVTPPTTPRTSRISFADRKPHHQVARGRRQCGSVDDVLMAAADRMSIDEWVESTLHGVEEPASTDTNIGEKETEQAVRSILRKGSYEEDDMILIDNVIYI